MGGGELIIYTDGSYSIPMGKGGWAFIVIRDGEVMRRMHGTLTNSTSNRAELTAMLEALKWSKDRVVRIMTDSQYTFNGITKWRHGWKKKNWNNVTNADLWIEIDKHMSHSKTVKWIKGHAGIYFNELADQLSKNY